MDSTKDIPHDFDESDLYIASEGEFGIELLEPMTIAEAVSRLSSRQLSVYNYITQYCTSSGGRLPTFDQIAIRFGIAKSHAHKAVARLCDVGLIERVYRSKGLRAGVYSVYRMAGAHVAIDETQLITPNERAFSKRGVRPRKNG